MGLTAPRGTGLSPPGGNGFRRKPDRQASPLAQAGVVLSPVRHPVPLLGDAMSTGGIGLEGHGEDLYSEANQAVTLSSRGYQLAHPCNKAAERGKRTRNGIKLGICGEHGGDPASIHFCQEDGSRLRVVLALSGADCPPCRRPSGARRQGCEPSLRNSSEGF